MSSCHVMRLSSFPAGLGSCICAGSLIIQANFNPTTIQLQCSFATPDRMMLEYIGIPFWKLILGCVHITQQRDMASAPARLNRSSSRHTTSSPPPLPFVYESILCLLFAYISFRCKLSSCISTFSFFKTASLTVVENHSKPGLAS